VHVIREDGHFVDVYPAPRCGVTDCRSHDIRVSAPERTLPQSRVPGDMHVQAEGSMGHCWLNGQQLFVIVSFASGRRGITFRRIYDPAE